MWGYPFFKLWFVILWFLDHSSLFTSHFSLLYQALQSFMKFKVHARDIAFDAEVLVHLQRLEVRVVRAVATAGHRAQKGLTPLCPYLGRRVTLFNGNLRNFNYVEGTFARQSKLKKAFLFCIVLTYWIKFSHSTLKNIFLFSFNRIFRTFNYVEGTFARQSKLKKAFLFCIVLTYSYLCRWSSELLTHKRY